MLRRNIFSYIKIAISWRGVRSVTKKTLFSLRKLPYNREVRGHCMCKEMPVILVDRVVGKKRIIGKNGEPRRRKGTRGR
jgi:hypothetical protein